MVDRNPHAIVIIGGDRYDSWQDKQLVKRVTVELATDQASEASFTCFDPRFHILDKYAGADGVPQLVMLFYLGFGQELGPPVFKGLLARVERGSSDTTFLAYDMGYKMRRELKTEYHENLNDLEILRKLAIRNGLKFEGPDSTPSLEAHPSMPQDSKNDWEHAAERARESGFNIYVRQDTLFAKEPAKIGAPILTLKYRKDFVMLHDFDLSYKLPENQQGRPQVVEYRGRKRGGRRLVGRSRRHSRGHKPVEIREDLALHSKPYADRRAHARKELQREPAFNCTIRSIPPLPRLRPDVRNTIALENLGKLFSGPYLCDKVWHELTGNNFATEYTLYRDIGR
ncbi:MAG TPA: hypothetical protein VNJ09_03920 [Chthonomonadales bacterium]|nr:hypothetical protein [Chthonomonadales bacterium]